MLSLIGNIIFTLRGVIIVQNYLNNLHGIVSHLLYLPFRILKQLSTFILFLFDERIAILEFILFEIIIEVAEKLAAVLRELFEAVNLFHL